MLIQLSKISASGVWCPHVGLGGALRVCYRRTTRRLHLHTSVHIHVRRGVRPWPYAYRVDERWPRPQDRLRFAMDIKYELCS